MALILLPGGTALSRMATITSPPDVVFAAIDERRGKCRRLAVQASSKWSRYLAPSTELARDRKR